MFRKMRRHGQQLDQATCEQILHEAPRGVLAVLGDDDYPYAVPLDFVYVPADEKDGTSGLGKIYFHCAVEGHKLDAIEAHDKASFCVMDEGVREEGDWWYHVNSVIAFGRMRRVTERDEMLALLRRLGGKYSPSEDYTEREIERDFARVAILELAIEHLTGKHVREK